MRNRTALTTIVAVVVTLVASLSASAAFPGKNGKIVFGSQHGGEDEIWVMDADGTNRHNLSRHDGRKTSDIDPRWSPDGQQIVYSSDPTGSMQIWVMNANGTSPRPLTDLPGRNRYPAFTADGKQIVFQSVVNGNFEIYRMNADGSGVTNLTNDPGVQWSPATSPRGKKIVFTRESGTDGHLYIWSPDEPLEQVTSSAGYDYFANWSPSGNDLVFTRFADGEDDIYLAHADGTGTRRLTNTPDVTEFFPAFSPDGTRITYTACGANRPLSAPNPTCTTHVMNLDGSGDIDLAFPAPAIGLPYTDNFDDNVRNVDHWNLLHDGTGGFVSDVNQRVELELRSDAVPSPGPFGAISVRYGFQCLLDGDFDARVDYQLLDWPDNSGATFQLHSFFEDATTSRQSQSWGESYSGFVPPGSFGAVATTDTAGTLRIVRSGSELKGYYESGGNWIEVVSGTANHSPAVLTVELASYGDAFAHERVRVAFDNFQLNAAEADLDCAQSTPDWHPDWQPVRK